MERQEAITFECGMCGDCCSSWNIPVEGEKARTLLSRKWVQERLQATRRNLAVIAGTDDLYRIPLTDTNECVFLGDDRRCLIQANEGAALKPRECQRFPFAAVRLPAEPNAEQPGKVVFETSAACKKISEKMLLAFASIKPKLSSATECFGTSIAENGSNLPHNSSGSASQSDVERAGFSNELLQDQDWLLNPLELECLSRLPQSVPVSLFRRSSWSDYDDWRKSLPAIFQSDLSPEAVLFAAFKKLKALPTGADRQEKAGTKPNVEEAKKVNKLINPNDSFSDWQFQWLALFFLRKPYRTMSWWQLIRRKKYDDPRLFGFTVTLTARNAVVWDDRHDRLVKAFLFNILNRRLPLSRGQTLTSLVAMAASALVLVRWYAITLASFRRELNDQQAIKVTSTDISSAIRLTERYYTGHQPHYMAWFSRSILPEVLILWLFRTFKR